MKEKNKHRWRIFGQVIWFFAIVGAIIFLQDKMDRCSHDYIAPEVQEYHDSLRQVHRDSLVEEYRIHKMSPECSEWPRYYISDTSACFQDTIPKKSILIIEEIEEIKMPVRKIPPGISVSDALKNNYLKDFDAGILYPSSF